MGWLLLLGFWLFKGKGVKVGTKEGGYVDNDNEFLERFE